MHCIVVDDDAFSVKIVSGFISRTKDLSLAEQFDNARDAIDYLNSPNAQSVDLIFLDIEMPDMTGIEFLQKVDIHDKEVVIYSSQEKYALESYEYDVCDYLLKPVTYERFAKAVCKASCGIFQKRNSLVQTESRQDDEIWLKDNNGVVHHIRYDNIVFVQSLENYVVLFTETQRITLHTTMKKILALLSANHVVRIHRSFAVGVAHIIKTNCNLVTVEFQGTLKDLPLGRTYTANLRKVVEGVTL